MYLNDLKSILRVSCMRFIALKSTFYYYFENPWKPPSLVTDNNRRFRHEQKRMRYIFNQQKNGDGIPSHTHFLVRHLDLCPTNSLGVLSLGRGPFFFMLTFSHWELSWSKAIRTKCPKWHTSGGFFPDDLKLAKVSPINKTEGDIDIKNSNH